jgi:hypothetical protein
MAAMQDFDHLLNWKLKAGSHRFPGRDGGTCINEAAVVAAGFEYMPVRSVAEMPDCFSRPICQLAMRLNDEADDDERQRLLPYVTRLACADDRDVERQRRAYIDARRWTSFDEGLKVLDGALAIGRQADPFGAGQIAARLQVVRSAVTTTSSVPQVPLVAQVKGWFRLKKQAEATQ